MFQLTKSEFEALRSQIGISNVGRGGRRYLPLAFTEQGVTMLSSVLHSSEAIQVNIAVVRTFVALRQMLESHRDLAQKIAQLEKKYDSQFKAVFDAIRQMLASSSPAAQKKIKGLSGS